MVARVRGGPGIGWTPFSTASALPPGGSRRTAVRYAEAMEQMVITILGDDRAGLVDVLSGAIGRHGGNWERSEMIELAGTFAGVVLVSVASSKAEALCADLEAIEAKGLLNIEVAKAKSNKGRPGHRFSVEITGQDHPGIIHEISHALAENNVNIEELSSEVVPAPMGGRMFVAIAVVDAPQDLGRHGLRSLLEQVATDLMVDVEVQDG